MRAVRVARTWLDAYEATALAEASRRAVAREAGAVDTAGWLRDLTGMTRREALARTRTAEGENYWPQANAIDPGPHAHG